VIRDEKDAVLAWEAELEEARRLLAEQSQASHVERRSIWSSVWDAVTELTS
jgi:putative heme iron utilization protein